VSIPPLLTRVPWPAVSVFTAVYLQIAAAFLASPAIHEVEERYNAAHAALLLLGGPSLLIPLQYQPFCGGCTVDAALGAVSFAVLGPSVLAWRLVPVFFFAVSVIAGSWLSFRVSGRAGAVACAVIFALAPPAYQELALIGNGNHPEGGAILVVEVALAVALVQARCRVSRVALLVALAILVGFGVYVVRSLLPGLAVLAMGIGLAPWRPRWRLAAILPAACLVVVGALPVLAVHADYGAWPFSPIYQADEWVPSLRWIPRNLASLLLPVQIRGIWGDGAWTLGGFPAYVAFGAWSLATVLLVRGPTTEDGGTARRILLGTLGTFLAAILVFRLSVWMDGVSSPSAQQVRYLGILWPLGLTCAGAGVGRLLSTRRAWLGGALLLALVLPGFVGRLRSLTGGDPHLAWRRLAPDWCFQQERVRGDLATLQCASAGSPLPLVPLASGILAANPHFALKATGRLPVLFEEDPLTRSARSRGRVSGVLLDLRDHFDEGEDPAWVVALARALPEGTVPREELRRGTWCQARERVWRLGLREVDASPSAIDPSLSPEERTTARAVLSLARGAGAARACVRETGPGALSIRWDETCETFLPDADAESAGWGLGVSAAEARAAHLEQLRLTIGSATSETSFKSGFDVGWRWGTRLYWLPERLPSMEATVENRR